MSVSKSKPVAKYIPFLRRYARALTGTQSSGDAYVAAALEALVEDPSVLESGRDPRKALFHMFTKIWKSVALNKTTAAVDSARPPEQRLANLRTLSRQQCELTRRGNGGSCIQNPFYQPYPPPQTYAPPIRR